MKLQRTRLEWIVAPLMLAAVSACRGLHSEDTSAAAQSKDAALAEVKRITNEQVEAWNKGDVEQFMALGYYRSPDLTFYSGGKISHGYDEMLAHYIQRYKSEGKETGQLAFTNTEYMPVSDSVMIARGRWDLDFAVAKDIGGLFTLLLWRFPEGWRIVHDHTSVDG